jgi:hypothetical protein
MHVVSWALRDTSFLQLKASKLACWQAHKPKLSCERTNVPLFGVLEYWSNAGIAHDAEGKMNVEHPTSNIER